ncbi:MAG TPA: hypothetical protein VNF47_27560 [Streptosporangiaceae bacterium]|nr:hypothetical protein [Streptosporangiaceae bacterium]
MTRSLRGPSAAAPDQPPTGRRSPARPASRSPLRDPVPWLRSADWRPAQVLVWGAHGGAGTSTLAAWLQPACDMGSMRPGLVPRYPAWVANGRPVIVTCGTTAHAAHAATAAVTAVTRAGAAVCVLAVVSDGWPEPPVTAARFRLLEPQIGAIVRVPFVPGLRLADDPAAVPLPRQARRAVEQIRAAAGLPPALPPVPDLPQRS